MSAALKSRLVRLERKSQARRLPRVIAYIYDMKPSEIVGFRGGGTFGENQCERQPGESLNDCAARAFDSVGSTFLAAEYPRPSAAEDDLPHPPSSDDPSGSDGSDRAPADLGGIGRRATRAELERMGALPVPPERQI